MLQIRKKPQAYCLQLSHLNVPEGIRTPDPRLRRPLLYPTELRTHFHKKYLKRYVTDQLSAPRVGLEPTTTRLTAECSTIELSRIMCLSVLFVLCSLNQHPYYNTSCKFVNTFFKENSIFLIACLIYNDSKHFKEDYTLNRCYFPLNKMHQPVN